MYRLSQRSLLECLAAVPVVGLQNYIRSYNLLLAPSEYTYFSPYGVKSAPLRNVQLETAIKHTELLGDGRYTVFEVSASKKPKMKRCDVLLTLWILTTWIFFAGLLVAIMRIPWTTWISVATCTAYTGWSILLRLVEYFNVIRSPVSRSNISDPDAIDAVFILGRSNSAFVLQGARQDIKNWTSQGLVYRQSPLGIPAPVWKAFTRLGSFAVLLLIFSTIPNASTADQVVFVILNAVAQLNVLVGPRLHGQCSLSGLSKIEDSKVPTRTHVYAKLIKHFHSAEEEKPWVDAAALLPRTKTWDTWKEQVVLDDEKDPKVLYHELSHSGDVSYEAKGSIE